VGRVLRGYQRRGDLGQQQWPVYRRGPVTADHAWGAGLRAPANNYLVALGQAASASGVNTGNNVGFIGGGQIGYNYQFYNSLVAGIEADIQGVASSGASRSASRVIPVVGSTIGDSFTGVQSARGNLDFLGTVRGRLGWLAMPNLLLYGTGGLAYGGVSLRTTSTVYSSGPNPDYLAIPASGGVNFTNTQVGWTAGGGVEWMFMPNWSVKAEYLYYDLGTMTQNFSMIANDAFSTGAPVQFFNPNAIYGGQVRARINGNVVRAGVNYHFNWGSSAPVVAKY
jgi:outer membrane immunogenic protein